MRRNHKLYLLFSLFSVLILSFSQAQVTISKKESKYHLYNNSGEKLSSVFYDSIIPVYTNKSKIKDTTCLTFYIAYNGSFINSLVKIKIVDHNNRDTVVFKKIRSFKKGEFDLYDSKGNILHKDLNGIFIKSHSSYTNDFSNLFDTTFYFQSSRLENSLFYKIVMDSGAHVFLKSQKGWGVINNDGYNVLPFLHDTIFSLSIPHYPAEIPTAFIIAKRKGKIYVYNQTYKMQYSLDNYDNIIPIQTYHSNEGLEGYLTSNLIKRNNKYGLLSSSFKELIQPIYDTILFNYSKESNVPEQFLPFGWAIAITGGKWAYVSKIDTGQIEEVTGINDRGEEITKIYKYTDVRKYYYLTQGLIDLFDHQGNLLVKNVSQLIMKGEFGLPINIFKPIDMRTFDFAHYSYNCFPKYDKDSIIIASVDSKWGGVNLAGKSVIPFKYRQIKFYGNYYYAIGDSSRLFNCNGEVIFTGNLDTLYFDVSITDEKKIDLILKISDQCYFINKASSNTLSDLKKLPDSLLKVRVQSYEDFYFDDKGEHIEIIYTLTNLFGEHLNKENYYKLTQINEGYIVSIKDVSNNYLTGFVDLFGKVVLPFVYKNIELLYLEDSGYTGQLKVQNENQTFIFDPIKKTVVRSE